MTNELLWQGFQYNWPMMTTPQDAVGAAQATANTGTFTGPEQHMAFPGLSGGLGGLLTWIPLWNTLALLTSSFTVHVAHTALKNNDRKKFNLWLGLTLVLGFTFVGLQILEYYEAYAHYGLKLSSGIYGSTFFILTGFHGFHVIIGTLFLTVCLVRLIKYHFTTTHHFGFEAAA